MPTADFELHNSLYLVAHFHNVLIAGVIFASFAGYSYWFPKAFGFVLDERLGESSHSGSGLSVGFWVAWGPGYVVGLEGMTRRLQHYDVAAWHPWLVLAAFGVLILLAGIAVQALQLIVSIRTRGARRDLTGDPWNGRNLEWSVGPRRRPHSTMRSYRTSMTRSPIGT